MFKMKISIKRIKEPCDYCMGDTSVRSDLIKDRDTDLAVYIHHDNSLVLEGNDGLWSTGEKINYCPICGRSL